MVFAKWVVKGRFGNILIGIRDDEPRVRFTSYIQDDIFSIAEV